MTTLVLGGTSWLGGRVAAAALAAGEEVTCLARGKSGAAPAGTTFVAADREAPGAYDAVRDRSFDLVVDVSWQPGQVRSALAALGSTARHWVYVSSCSVYADQSKPGMDESTPLLDPLEGDHADREQYGPAKVACEQLCTQALGDRVLLARAGLIAGHGDLSDRFGYWPGRLALAAQDGGPVLVPAGADDAPAQAIDVEDLASFLVGAGMRGVGGHLNVVGPRWTFGQVLRACVAASGFDGELVPVPSAWLQAEGVEEYMGRRSLPLWLHDPDYAGFSDRVGAKATAAGLTYSSLNSTVRSSLAWERQLGLDRPRKAGLTRAEETDLLDRFAASSG